MFQGYQFLLLLIAIWGVNLGDKLVFLSFLLVIIPILWASAKPQGNLILYVIKCLMGSDPRQTIFQPNAVELTSSGNNDARTVICVLAPSLPHDGWGHK